MNISEFEYLEAIYPFKGNFALFENDCFEFGIIDRKGEVLLEPTNYDRFDYLGDTGLFVFEKDDERIIYDANTRSNFTLKALDDYSCGFFTFVEDGKVGLCDANYQTVIDPIYDSLSFWNDKILARKDGKFGIIDRSGSIVCPFIYSPGNMELFDQLSGYRVLSIDDQNIWVNNSGERISKNTYDYLECKTSRGYALAKIDGFLCVIDSAENVIFTTIYKEKEDNDNNKTLFWCGPEYLAFRQNGLYGIMDVHGTVVVEPKYSALSGNPYSDIIVACDNSQYPKWGVIHPDGSLIIPFDYYMLHHSDNEQFIKAYTGDWGILDLEGKEIIPFEYEAVCPSDDLSFIPVKKDGMFYFVNDKNERVA